MTATLAWSIGALIVAAVIGAGVWWNGLRDRPAPLLSIAVMPFKDLTGDADETSLTEGLAYDVTTELSRLPDLFVISHASARTFARTDRDAREIGRAVNVRYLLDGSVHRSGDQLRINVQLIDTTSGASVWGDRFERRHDELLGWRDEIIGRMANVLNLHLTALDVRGFVWRIRRRTQSAHDAFRTVVALNPNFARPATPSWASPRSSSVDPRRLCLWSSAQ